MSGLIGKKVGMTSLYDAEGNSLGCTVLEAGPNVVTHVKTIEKDGYKAIQLGYGERGEKNATSAAIGHFKKAGTTPKSKTFEFKEFPDDLKLGDTVDMDIFEEQMRQRAPAWTAFDMRMMFQGYLERGFVAEKGDLETLTSLLGHAPRRYEDFAQETLQAWQGEQG